MAVEDPKENLLVLERYAEKNSKQFTLEDASSVTGMPIIETEEAIKTMMERYDCKLKVTENGDLIYDFGTQLSRRTKKSFGEYVQQFFRAIWKGFQISYKFLTAIALVVYFVVFLVLLIAAAVSSEDGDGIGDALAVLFRLFLSIFEWSTIMGYNQRYYTNDDYGYKYQHYKERPGVLNWGRSRKKKKKNPKDKKGFVASIYDFIFGPPRVQLDPLANNQEVATFLKEQKGLIVTSEVQALAGWTREEAENFLTECLGMFDGQADVSDNGTLYGDFSQLIRSKDRTGEAPVIWYWDEYEPEYELTGNSTWRNVLIVLMNTFNFLASLVIFSGAYSTGTLGTAFVFFLGTFPLVYCSLFFLIPLVRWFRIRPLRKKQREMNIRKRLMRVVFQTYDQGKEHVHEIPLSKLTEVANTIRKTEEKLDSATVDRVMKDTLADLGGEAYLNDQNEIIYKFELIAQELNAVDSLRNEKRDDSDLGEIIFEA